MKNKKFFLSLGIFILFFGFFEKHGFAAKDASKKPAFFEPSEDKPSQYRKYFTHDKVMSPETLQELKTAVGQWNENDHGSLISFLNKGITLFLTLSDSDEYEKDDFEATNLLISASDRGDLPLVEYLLTLEDSAEQKLDLDQKESTCNYTALLAATKNNHSKVAKTLIQHKANVERKDCFQQTAVFYAVENSSKQLIAELSEVDKRVLYTKTLSHTLLSKAYWKYWATFKTNDQDENLGSRLKIFQTLLQDPERNLKEELTFANRRRELSSSKAERSPKTLKPLGAESAKPLFWDDLIKTIQEFQTKKN